MRPWGAHTGGHGMTRDLRDPGFTHWSLIIAHWSFPIALFTGIAHNERSTYRQGIINT